MFGELKAMLGAGELRKITSQHYIRALEGDGQQPKSRIAFLGGLRRHHARAGRRRQCNATSRGAYK
jgi:hypothetical protein